MERRTSRKISVQCILSNSTLREDLRAFFQTNSSTVWLRHLERADQWEQVVRDKPDVLLLEEIEDAGISIVEVVRKIKERQPNIAIFVLTPQQASKEDLINLHRSLMQASTSGVFELSKTVNFQDWIRPMRNAVKLLRRIPDREADARATVIAVHSLKGGTGKTLLGVNLAAKLAQETRQGVQNNVLFLDFNWPFGGSNAFLNHNPNRSMLDLLPIINELNEDYIRRAATVHPKLRNLHILSAPLAPELSGFLSDTLAEELLFSANETSIDDMLIELYNGRLAGAVPDADKPFLSNIKSTERRSISKRHALLLASVLKQAKARQAVGQISQNILSAVRNYYDFVIIDLPSTIDEMVITVLRNADRVFLTTTPSLPEMRALRTNVELMAHYRVNKKNIRLVLNRTHRGSTVTSEQVRDIFKGYIWLPDLPLDSRLDMLVNTGTIPSVWAGRSKYSRAVSEIAAALQTLRKTSPEPVNSAESPTPPTPTSAPPTPKPSMMGMLQKLRGSAGLAGGTQS